jgi:hypothetical protein
VGRECAEWLKPLEPVQYLGSVAQGLGFFHVEVQEETTRSGFLKFLDNCAMLLIEEGRLGLRRLLRICSVCLIQSGIGN